MSKAKELAHDILEILSDGVYPVEKLIVELAEEVLSEPDEQDGLKGWIETVDGKGLRTLLSVASGSYMREMGIEDGESCRAIFHSNRGIVCFTESYDEIKQKIKESL